MEKACHTEAHFPCSTAAVLVSRGSRPNRFGGNYLTERLKLGEHGAPAVPDSTQEEYVEVDSDDDTTEGGGDRKFPRYLYLAMNEEGIGLNLTHYLVGGYSLFGDAHLYAVYYDEWTGSSWYSDVTQDDIDAVPRLLHERKMRDVAAMAELEAQGFHVFKCE